VNPIKALKFVGYAWCVAVVIGYLAYWMLSEHGGGILSRNGTFDIWLIALAWLPGVAMIKLSKSKNR
jgi:hypothetical protein